MKTFKYILLILSLGIFNSCLVDDKTNYELNDAGINLAGFTLTATTVSGIADGTEYQFDMRVRVTGPSKTDLKNDITLTIAVDPASTAVEGVHYRIENPKVVLKASDNYLGVIPIIMTTEGIATPLEETPVLILNTVSATGDAKVTNNGKPLAISMNFACFSEFQGTYTVVTTNGSSGVVRTRTETITKIGVEKYLTSCIGTWATPLSLTYGFVFENSCNVISVPAKQSLANIYSNEVFGTKMGSVDPVTGVITIYYTITFAAGNTEYTAVYTPVL